MSAMKLTTQNWRLFSESVRSLMIDMITSTKISKREPVEVFDLYTGESLYCIMSRNGTILEVSVNEDPDDMLSLDLMDSDFYELQCICEALC